MPTSQRPVIDAVLDAFEAQRLRPPTKGEPQMSFQEAKEALERATEGARALGDREPGPMGDAEALAWCAQEVRRLDALLASQRLPELSMP